MKTPTGLKAKVPCFSPHRDDHPALPRHKFKAVTQTWLSAACAALVCPLLASAGETVAHEQDEVGLNHRVWKEVIQKTDLTGKTFQTTNAAYVELATGLYYSENSVLKESQAEFEISPEGYATANRGQHKVSISPLLADKQGAVNLQTPDGKRMRSTLRGLYLFNRRSGQTLLVASANPSAAGTLVAPNEVLFTNAFDGFGASVRYRYGLGNFHQNVILTERLNLKELAAAGFPSEFTTLEIWTEFLEAPEAQVRARKVRGEKDPQLRAQMAEPDVYDEALDFGVMKMPMGKAYLENQKATGQNELRVNKRWVQMEGRRFLIESISLDRADVWLAQLPAGRASEDWLQGKPLYAERRAPATLEASRHSQTIQMAGLDLRSSLAQNPQFVIDYDIVISQTGFTFRGDTTYYVSGNVYLRPHLSRENQVELKPNVACL